MTLLYFDLRVRTEGFDLALLADSAMDEEANLEEIVTQPPPPTTSSLATQTELGYFVLLSLGAAAIFAAFYGIIAMVGSAVGLAAGGYLP
jgi:hypothetical protein